MIVPESSSETQLIFFMRCLIFRQQAAAQRGTRKIIHLFYGPIGPWYIQYPSKLKKEHLEIIPAIRLDCLPSLHRPTFVRGQFRRLSQAHPPPLPHLHSIASSGLQLSSDGLPHLFVLKSSPTIMRTSNFSTKG